MSAQLSFPTRQTQQDRILNLLRSKEWVPLPEILDLRVAKYSSRISELRAQGYIIECKALNVGRQRRTEYCLVFEPGVSTNVKDKSKTFALESKVQGAQNQE